MYLASLINTWSPNGSPRISSLQLKKVGSESCSISIRDSLLKCAISMIDGSLGRSI